MFEGTWRRLQARYTWLDPKHPVAVRDAHWAYAPLPGMIRRLSNIWSVLGYSAIIHGAFFVVAILSYNYLTTTLMSLFMPFLSPFMTPFGIPIAAAFLHTFLYWAMLIGLCNQVSVGFAAQFSSGSWRLLRLTPYTTTNLMLTKMLAVGRNWGPVLKVLFWLRLLALLAIPVSTAALRGREITTTAGQNVFAIVAFMAQPYADVLLVVGLSALVATLVRQSLMARFGAYAVVALVMGGLNLLACLLLTVLSPLGPLSGVFLPMPHWMILATAALPPVSQSVFTTELVAVALLDVALPIIIGGAAIALAIRVAKADRA